MLLKPALIDKLHRALGEMGARVLLLSDNFASTKTAASPVAFGNSVRLAENVWGYSKGSTLSVVPGSFRICDLPVRSRPFTVLFDSALPGPSAHLMFEARWPEGEKHGQVQANLRHPLPDGKVYRLRATLNADPELLLTYVCGGVSDKLFQSSAARWIAEGGPSEVRLIDSVGRVEHLVCDAFTVKVEHNGRKFVLNPLLNTLTYFQTQ